jgi:hypothetical protein
MDLEQIKKLVTDAAEARVTRDFPPLINMERVRDGPMRIDRDRYLRVSDKRAPAFNRQGKTHDVRGYLGNLHHLLYRTIMPHDEGGAGFVLAGGALHHALLARYERDLGYELRQGKTDLDFFPVGLGREQADLLVRRFISLTQCFDESNAAFLAKIRGYPEWNDTRDVTLFDLNMLMVGGDLLAASIYRTPNAVTIIMGGGKTIQLITRLYPTRESVVRDFDLAPAQFLWDGFHVWTTELGALCYSTGCFPLELGHCLCPRTYARRLRKYLKRGYTLLLLDADVEKATERFFLPGLGCFIEASKDDPLRYVAETTPFQDRPDDDQPFWPLRDEVTTRIDGTERDLEADVKRAHPELSEAIEEASRLSGDHDPIHETTMINRHRPVYLYRAMSYNIPSCFIANMLALLRESVEQALAASATSQRCWRALYMHEAGAGGAGQDEAKRGERIRAERGSTEGSTRGLPLVLPPHGQSPCNGRGDTSHDRREGRGTSIQWRVCDGATGDHYVLEEIDKVTARLDWPEYRWLREPLTAISAALAPEQIFEHVHELLSREEPPQEIEWSDGPPSGIPVDPDAWYGPIADHSWRAKAGRH